MPDGRVALVTGASRGIGRAVAERLYRQGCHIILNYRASDAAAAQVASELKNDGRVVLAKADVSDPSSVAQLRDVVRSEFGRLDILVNNVGATCAAPWAEVSPELWRQALDTNLSSTFYCIQAFAPMLATAQDGCIVNIGSTYGEIGIAQIAAYGAAKAGIISLTRAFAKELAPSVRVNAIAPGNIDTDMTRAAGEELVQMVIEQTPLGRLGRPAEIADAAEFLVSERASFITGQVLVVDGGHGLR